MPFAASGWKRLNVDLGPARFVRRVGEPFSIERDLGVSFIESRLEHGKCFSSDATCSAIETASLPSFKLVASKGWRYQYPLAQFLNFVVAGEHGLAAWHNHAITD